MRFNKNVARILVLILIVAAFAIGCTPARRPMVDRNDNNDVTDLRDNPGVNPGTNQGNVSPGTIRPDQYNPNNNGNNGLLENDNVGPDREIGEDMNNERETRIADAVKRIDGVRDAVVLMNDNTAYVGVDMGRNIEGQETNDIKDEVERRVKAADRTIDRVYVSADVDIFGRLQGYGRDIRGGRPITGFIDEIQEMFRRPIPR